MISQRGVLSLSQMPLLLIILSPAFGSSVRSSHVWFYLHQGSVVDAAADAVVEGDRTRFREDEPGGQFLEAVTTRKVNISHAPKNIYLEMGEGGGNLRVSA